MKTRYTRGTTAQLNALNLEPGQLAIDTEKKAVRLFDGQTQGGYEMLGTQAYAPPDTGPGPLTISGGDDLWGFYGEVASSDFITGDALATAVGLSAGTLLNADTPWLKFNSNGQIVFIPKKAVRSGLRWEEIYQAGVVYATGDEGLHPSGTPRVQDAVVSFDGYDYRVRLMRGANADPTVLGADGLWTGFDPDLSHGSEFNRLMYRILDDSTVKHTSHTTASEPSDRWALYSEAELGFHYSDGDGSYTWCQEQNGDNASYRILRGYAGMARYQRDLATGLSSSYGWRPVLELIQ